MKQYESELIQQLRAGMDHIVLPATVEEFYSMVDLLTVKKVEEPKAFVDKYFKSRLRVLEQQRDSKFLGMKIARLFEIGFVLVLKSFLEYEYLHLER